MVDNSRKGTRLSIDEMVHVISHEEATPEAIEHLWDQRKLVIVLLPSTERIIPKHIKKVQGGKGIVLRGDATLEAVRLALIDSFTECRDKWKLKGNISREQATDMFLIYRDEVFNPRLSLAKEN